MKSLKKLNRTIFFLLIIIIFGLWFRIQGLLYGTFAFTYDVGRDLLALLQIVDAHKLPLIGATTGLHGIFYGPTWYYLLTPFFLLFQGDPKGLMLFIVLSGVLTIFVGFKLGKCIGGNVLGLIIALLISLSQVLTGISAQIWNPNLIPLFVIIIFYVIIFKFNTNKKQHMWFFIGGILLGIIFDLEIVFGILFAISSFIYFLSVNFIRRARSMIFFIIGFILIQSPRILFEMRHEFLMTKTFIASLTSHSQSSILTPSPNFSKVFLVLFNIWTDTVSAQVVLLGIIMGILVGISLFLSFRKLNQKEKNLVKYLLIILAVYFIGLSFLNHDIESHYYIGLPLIFILLVSISIFTTWKYFRTPKFGIVILVILAVIGVNQFKILDTFHKYTWIGDASVYRNQLEVIDFIYKDAKNEKFNYATYTPPIFDYPYQYLFQWEGKKAYGYLPDEKHQRLFYLIIEPDLQIPERQSKWLEVRKDDGTIISEKIFPSGIRLQIRFH